MKDFVIPVHPEDLLIAGDRYSVKGKQDIDAISEGALRSKLSDIADQLKAQPLSISEERENFDFIFSCINQFAVLPTEAKNNILEALNTGLSGTIPMVKRLLASNSESSEDFNNMLRDYRDVLKKYMFLLNWIIQLQDKANANTTAASKTANATKPKGKGRKSTKKNDNEEETAWENEGQKERILSAVLHSLELDLPRLWKLDIPEEDFLNLYSKICYLMLENPANTRSKAIKKCIFMIIGQLVKKYNQTFNAVNSIIHLLHNFEHLPPHLAELMEVLVNDYDAPQALSEMMREIGRMSPQDVAQDSGGVKNISTFIAETSERLPKTTLPTISLLLVHLDTESYTIRNGIVQVVGFLICKAFIGEEHHDKSDTRDSLLTILLERLRDVSSWTRSKTLQTWQYLFQERAVPLKMLQPVAEAVTGRLEDKANQVRKNATQLLTTMMQFNPYHAKLSLSFFKEKSKFCKTLLEEYQSKKKALRKDDDREEDEDEEGGEDDGPPVQMDRAKLQQLVEGTPYEAVLGTDAANVYGTQVLDHLRTFHRWSSESAEFIETLHKAVPLISELLGSKNASDVLEAIQFFVSAKEFGLQTAQDGILKMLALIFNKEANIKEALVEAFRRLYTNVPSNTKHANYFIAKNLISLTFKANLGELTALEELLTELMKNGHITPGVIQAMWDIFAMKIPGFDKDDSRGALILLTMAANADPEIIRSKLNLVINVGLGPRWKEDQLLAKYACIAVQKIRKKGQVKDGPAESFGRYPNSHPIFEKLSEIVMDLSIPHSKWFSPAEQAINAIFLLSEHPDHICSKFVKTLSALIFLKQKAPKASKKGKNAKKKSKAKKGEDEDEEMQDEDAEKEEESEKEEEEEEQEEKGEGEEAQGGDAYKKKCSSSLLSRFLFVVGHVALKQLVHIEEIQNEIRKKRQAKESSNQPDKEKKKGKKPVDVDNIEKELGTEAAAAETEHELLQEAAERELVSSSLLGRFGPIIVAVVTNAGNKYNDPALQTSAVLALCKLMCVHSAFCEKNLQLVFTVLQKSPDSALRSNIVIALGDLAFRFPNIVEPWTSHMSDRLKDNDSRVRKNTLMVLTHLILNDMIRGKGQISEMAVCLEDKESRIADLAHLFFHELSQKGNDLYNILPDAISKLSIDTRVGPEMFDSIMKYLFSFIQKEKQSESLVEKMCVRFRATKEPQEWRCIALCLSLLSYNDKAIKKLSEYFKCYQDKLADEEILGYFYAVINKTRKFAKADMKSALDELEQKIVANQKATDENNEGGATAPTGESSSVRTTRTKAATTAKGKGKAPAKKARAVSKPGKKATRYIESDDESEEDEEESEEEFLAKANRRTLPKPAPKAAASKKDDDEDEEGEEEEEEKSSKGKKRPKSSDEDEEDEPDEEVAPKKKAPAPKKATSGSKKAAAPKPAPKKAPPKRKPAAKKTKKQESDEDEEEEEEEEEAPVARKSSRASSQAASKKMRIESSSGEEDEEDD